MSTKYSRRRAISFRSEMSSTCVTTGGAAILVADDRCGHQHPDMVAPGVAITLLDLVTGDLRRRESCRRLCASRSMSSGWVIAPSVVAFSLLGIAGDPDRASLTCSQAPSMARRAMPIGALSNALSKRSRTSRKRCSVSFCSFSARSRAATSCSSRASSVASFLSVCWWGRGVDRLAVATDTPRIDGSGERDFSNVLSPRQSGRLLE